MKRFLFSLMLAGGLAACAPSVPEAAEPPAPPVMRWDFRPDSEIWTETTLSALSSHGAVLPQMIPADITEWCPDYPNRPAEDRAAFWSGLMSALAKHESTWRPEAVGGGGRWFGLVQIDPRTARAYGCAAQSGEALKDPSANLSCGVRIAAAQVSRRGTINRGMLDWGPFHSSEKRAEMSAWTRAQDYCTAKT